MLVEAILLIAVVIVQSDRCVQRSFGPDAIVCVCNSTYCDGIYESELQMGLFQLYTSTASGERLKFNIGNFSAEPRNGAFLLVVNSSQRYQEIHGFGGTLTDTAALNIKSLSKKSQQKLLESYFGSGGTGIGYTYVRLSVASTDFSTRPYTYDDTPGDVTLSNFSLVEEDNYKIEYLHQIKAIMSDSDSLRIFTSSWSAPTWMKTSNNITWGLLKPEYYQTYADYIRKYFDAYKKRGINIWGFIAQHEPMVGFTSNSTWFNAMGLLPNASVHWMVNYAVPTLSEAGYVPVYIALDDERDNLQWYVDDMFSNEEANKLYAGISVHWFEDAEVSPMVLTETHNKYPNKFIMMTQASIGDSGQDRNIEIGSWERGEDYILDIIENLSHWATGWINFNMAANENGGPNWAHNIADPPIMVLPENDEFYKQPMYYAMAHVSTFVPRYSHRISSTSFEDNQNLSTIAFLTPEKKIVVIIVNTDDEPVNVTIKNNNADENINLCLSANSFNTLLYLAHQ